MAFYIDNSKIQIGKFATGSGTNSIAIGTNSNASALNSICIGESTSAAEYGISIGYACYSGTTTGTGSNICIGLRCGRGDSTLGNGYNIALGYDCFVSSNTSFGHTIAIGNACIYTGQSGSYNVGIGASALYSLSRGIYNNAIGWGAGYSGTTFRHNQFIGTNAGYYIEGVGTTTGYSNVCIGHAAGDALSTGNYNICIGYAADGAAGVGNVVSIGYDAQCAADNGVAIGISARATYNSVAFGYNARCTGGQYNIAIGANSQATKNYAIAIGGGVTGGGCIASGIGSICIGGGDAVGNYTRATGDYSIALGRNSRATANYAIAIGPYSNASNSALASGIGSIAIGSNAQATGQYSIALGVGAVASGTDSIAIGVGCTAAANYACYGNPDAQEYHRFYVTTGMGLGHGMMLCGTTPMSLDLNNTGVNKARIWHAVLAGHYISNNPHDEGITWTGTTKSCWFLAGSTAVCKMNYLSGNLVYGGTWGNISDIRLKTNITDCPSMLETCRSLKVRRFTLLDEPDKFYYGWISQEVLETLGSEMCTKYQLVNKRPKDPKTGIEYYNLNTEQLLTMNFKATQELDDLCNSSVEKLQNIKQKNINLRLSLQQLKEQVTTLRNSYNTLLAAPLTCKT